MPTLLEKLKAFVALVGDESTAKQVLDQAEQTQSQLEGVGVRAKESADSEEKCKKCGAKMSNGKCPECNKEVEAKETSGASKCKDCGTELVDGKCPKCEKEAGKEGTGEASKKELADATSTGPDIYSIVESAVRAQLLPLLEKLELIVIELEQAEDKAGTQEGSLAEEQAEEQEASKRAWEELKEIKTKTEAITAEVASLKEVGTLAAQILNEVAALKTESTSIKTHLAALEGDQPRGRPASQSLDNILGSIKDGQLQGLTEDGLRLKEMMKSQLAGSPQGPLVDFFSRFDQRVPSVPPPATPAPQ